MDRVEGQYKWKEGLRGTRVCYRGDLDRRDIQEGHYTPREDHLGKLEYIVCV